MEPGPAPGFILLDKAPADCRQEAQHAGGIKLPASPKMQRAGTAFLLRLVAENGIDEAARALHEFADDIEGLEREESGDGRDRRM